MANELSRLSAVFNQLDDQGRAAVLDYASHILHVQTEVESRTAQFFICPTCFAVGESPRVCHGQWMIACDAASPEDCKPLMDASGDLKGRAPRWFLEASLRRLTRLADDD